MRRGAGDDERSKRSGVTSRRQADRYAQARHFRPPGRLMFLRPVKGRRGEGGAHRRFEAVWVDAEELVAEGMLVSPRMMADHMPDRLCKARAAEQHKAPTGCTLALLVP